MIYLSARALSLCVFPPLFGHVSKMTSAKQRLRMRYSVNYLHAEFFFVVLFFVYQLTHLAPKLRTCECLRAHAHASVVSAQPCVYTSMLGLSTASQMKN